MKKWLMIIAIVFCITLLEIYSVSTAKESSIDVVEEYQIGKVSTDILKIRSGLSLENQCIGLLYKGDEVEIYGKSGNWYIAKTNDNTIGAVCADYVEIKQDEITKTEENQIEECILSEDEQEFLNLINEKRKENNLEEFKINEEIQNIARLKCKDLVENNYFSHKSDKYGNLEEMLSKYNISFRSSSENIAKSSNLESAVNLFMKSENHSKNILSTRYQYTGIAVQNKYDGNKIFLEIFVEK